MDASATFHHQRITFTGRLASMSRRQACELVHSCRGRVSERVSRKTRYLIVGSDGWPLRPSGRLTKNLERAGKLQQQGAPVEVIGESAFLKRLRLMDPEETVHRRYHLEQLSRMIGVSGLRLRRWVEAGLIEPVDFQGGVPLFDFAQVAATRTLWRLASGGCRLGVLRESLLRLGRWLPDASRTAESLERVGRLLVVRTADGELVDACGQKLMDFDRDDDAVMALSWSSLSSTPSDPDAAFAEAVRWEQTGNSSRAIEAYELWIDQFGSDPDVLMNLGNLLMARGQAAGAAQSFRQAVESRADDCRLWNNLGLALADAGDVDEAIAALDRSIACNRDFADAYYNLADLLEDQGQHHRARLLWRKYLQYDVASEHAEYAQQQLTAGEQGTQW